MSKSTRLSTANSLFLDTSGCYALLVERDEQHIAAKRMMREAMKGLRRAMTNDHHFRQAGFEPVLV